MRMALAARKCGCGIVERGAMLVGCTWKVMTDVRVRNVEVTAPDVRRLTTVPIDIALPINRGSS